VPASIIEGGKHAHAVGILKEEPKLDKLVDLSLLNSLLKERGKPQVNS
jgi:hypothetical protein